MMRSMFSGVSGLKAHQTRMDVIGNNVANVNTIAFKSGRVTFQEVFSQTLRGAGASDQATGRGGTNPMQVGLGLGVGTVDTIMTRGSVQRTDNPTDLSIEGDGFFVVQGGSGDTYRFTRAGNFMLDERGNLVNGAGMNVMGWQYYGTANGEYTYDTEKPIEAINLFNDGHNGNKRIIAASPTENVSLVGNLDASKADGYNFRMPMTVYDSLGNDYKIDIVFTKGAATSTSTTWNWAVDVSNIPDATVTVGGAAASSILFAKNGKPDFTTVQPAENFEITLPAAGANQAGTDKITVDIDLSALTQFSDDSSAQANVDGYPTGSLVTFNIGSDGILTGIYSNGQQQPLGMVAVATFENPAGMQKTGENLYIPTTNSGAFEKAVKAGTNGAGSFSPGTLEMSNVDLSSEFTDMIITQRGFQANSRIITTSDEMLQELVNLKR